MEDRPVLVGGSLVADEDDWARRSGGFGTSAGLMGAMVVV